MNKEKSTVEFSTTPEWVNINPPNKITISSPGTTMNKTEISNETKAKVFAQYWEPDAVRIKDIDNCEKIGFPLNDFVKKVFMPMGICDNGVGIICFGDPKGRYDQENYDNIKLLLTPLSKISDEDAIEVANILKQRGVNKEEETSVIEEKEDLINALIGQTDYEINDVPTPLILQIYQYLQSRGYDLPSFYLNGKTLFEAGLCIYKD